MKYQLVVPRERFAALQGSGLIINNITYTDTMVNFDVVISSGVDLLYLFHAGIHYGMRIMMEEAA
jgi:hypothetical protein